MSNKKQTALEWLIEKIEWHTGLEYLYEEDYVIKAKELEKQQIIDAWNDGRYENTGYGDSETHYNETFNK